MCCGRATLAYSGTILASVPWKNYFGVLKSLASVLWKSYYFGLLRDHFGEGAVEETLGYSGITLVSVLWKSYFGLLRDHFGECAVVYFGLLRALASALWGVCCGSATLGYSGSLWPACCGKGILGYSGTTLGSVEELLCYWGVCCGSVWGVCCGRATLGYSGISLGSVLWKGYFQLLSGHSQECAVEGLLWATLALWPVST